MRISHRQEVFIFVSEKLTSWPVYFWAWRPCDNGHRKLVQVYFSYNTRVSKLFYQRAT